MRLRRRVQPDALRRAPRLQTRSSPASRRTRATAARRSARWSRRSRACPPPAKKVIGDALTYAEDGYLDKKTGHYQSVITPSTFADKTHVEAELWCEPSPSGDANKCVRFARVKVEVKVFVVGRDGRREDHEGPAGLLRRRGRPSSASGSSEHGSAPRPKRDRSSVSRATDRGGLYASLRGDEPFSPSVRSRGSSMNAMRSRLALAAAARPPAEGTNAAGGRDRAGDRTQTGSVRIAPVAPQVKSSRVRDRRRRALAGAAPRRPARRDRDARQRRSDASAPDRGGRARAGRDRARRRRSSRAASTARPSSRPSTPPPTPRTRRARRPGGDGAPSRAAHARAARPVRRRDGGRPQAKHARE